MVEYIYEEKRRTHAVGLSLSRTHECYVKAMLTNNPKTLGARLLHSRVPGTWWSTFVGIVSSRDNLIRRS